ncbi:MAG: hypothetical protein JWM87_751 [Candidatus Eremiobacteraeota bacterium]|nr:hypothetical protein [Candidatus Eremiobacteraeota bacterium]
MFAAPTSIGSADVVASGDRPRAVVDVVLECAAPIHDRCAEMTRGVGLAVGVLVGAGVPVLIGGGLAAPPLQAARPAAASSTLAAMESLTLCLLGAGRRLWCLYDSAPGFSVTEPPRNVR